MIPQKIIEVEVIDETCTIVKKKYNDEKVVPNIVIFLIMKLIYTNFR